MKLHQKILVLLISLLLIWLMLQYEKSKDYINNELISDHNAKDSTNIDSGRY